METNKLVWILEDDPAACCIYEEILEYRYKVQFFETLASFKGAMQSNEKKPDLILVDLRLSDGHFLKFLREEKASSIVKGPFMVISSSDDLDILRDCFKDGAVDYLIKPFKKTELIVKVERFLKQREEFTNQNLDGLGFDPSTLRVKFGEDCFAQLTAKELQIFSLLYRAKGQPISREEVKWKVWGDVHVSAKAFDVHLFHLRKKLIDLGIEIRFQPPDQYRLLIHKQTN